MKKIFTFITNLTLIGFVSAQASFMMAKVNENGEFSVEEIQAPEVLLYPNEISPDPFMTFEAPAFQYSKNTRGLTLADLDNDGVDELLIGIDQKFYAIKGDGSILFEVDVEGPILYPPAVADMDGDGDLEIVFNFGFSTLTNGTYVLDHQGNALDGWPRTHSTLISNAPALADLDDDGIMEIITAERISGTSAHIHVFKLDGTELNANWPYDIGSVSCFTPSVGDINNDGIKEVIVAGYNTGIFAIQPDGTILSGFPVYDPSVAYSYQSPVLVDLDGDDELEIVGANHGDASAYYVMNNDGTYADGWPYAIGNWTYAPPTVVDLDGDEVYEIFVGNPNFSEGNSLPTIYGMSPDGSDLANFPINKIGGNEGVITVADINNDGVMEIIFGSNITDSEGYGYLHAYSVDGSGEIDGFPLRPRGFTYLNGAVVGDIDNDGMMDISLNSYTLNFGASTDSLFISSYNLNVPYDESKILWNGYKGNNTRDGLLVEEIIMGTEDMTQNPISVYPNPSSGILNIQLKEEVSDFKINIFDLNGRNVFTQKDTVSKSLRTYNLSHLPPGTYVVQLMVDNQRKNLKWIKK